MGLLGGGSPGRRRRRASSLWSVPEEGCARAEGRRAHIGGQMALILLAVMVFGGVMSFHSGYGLSDSARPRSLLERGSSNRRMALDPHARQPQGASAAGGDADGTLPWRKPSKRHLKLERGDPLGEQRLARADADDAEGSDDSGTASISIFAHLESLADGQGSEDGAGAGADGSDEWAEEDASWDDEDVGASEEQAGGDEEERASEGAEEEEEEDGGREAETEGVGEAEEEAEGGDGERAEEVSGPPASAEQAQGSKARHGTGASSGKASAKPGVVDAAATAAEAALAAELVRREAEEKAADDQWAVEHPGADAAASSSDTSTTAAAEPQAQQAQAAAGAAGQSPYRAALQGCRDFACLKEAAKQPRGAGEFLFPHFMLLGFEKSGIASLSHHLIQHPAVQGPGEEAAEFFSSECDGPQACPADKQKHYILQTLHLPRALRRDLSRAAFEGSTHYAQAGPRLAQGLHEAFPWTKVVLSMREPISRAISMLEASPEPAAAECLAKRDVFPCLQQSLAGLNYSTPVRAWLEAFPANQVHLLQYEALTRPERAEARLAGLKSFLGLDPSQPPVADLPLGAGEEQQGWPIKRQQIEELVKLVKADAESISELVAAHGLDGKQWLKTWQKVWQASTNTCNLEEDCTLLLS